MNHEKKTVLITGASRGIGKAIAKEFGKHHYQLVINCHHNEALLLDLKKELEETCHVSCLAFVGDVGNENFVKEMFSSIEQTFGGVNLVINNAGISHIGLLSDMTLDMWNHVISTNLTSAFLCSKYAIPYMVHNKDGYILNISSMWGSVGASCEVAYSASKGGLHAFTKALAKELAPSNICVNALALGIIDTDMNQCFSKEERMLLEEETPIGRFGQASEVAEFVFSLTQNSRFLTGQVIGFDGGYI